MKNAIKQLPNDVPALKKYISSLETNFINSQQANDHLVLTNAQLVEETKKLAAEKIKIESEFNILKLQNEYLWEQFKLSKQRRFGTSSEKNVFQGDLFDEAGIELPEEAEADIAEEKEIITYERKKKTGQAKREALPDYLPREDHVYDIPEDQKHCGCGAEKVCFGKEVSEQLKVIPPQIIVVSHQRLKYYCPPCEGEISIADKPALFLPKSIADASLVAYTAVMKYVDHIPLYRQEKIWLRNKINLPRSTTCAWVMKAGELCEPLYEVMGEELRVSQYLQADETPIQVLKEPQRKDTQKSYMWIYRKAVGTPLIVYEYQQTRQGKHVKHFLSEFKGYIQTDAYSGYDWLDKAPEMIHVGCMAHARRPFAELHKLTKKKKGLAYEALKRIGVLYEIEDQIRAQDIQERYNIRQREAKPQLENLKQWLEEQVTRSPPKGKLGQAMRYMLTHWHKLIRYIDDGRLEIDNNRIENAIRPFALGRRNWMFAGNPRGARVGAILYSLLITAKANGLNEHAYLTFVFNRIRACETKEDYKALLPGYLTAEEQESLMLIKK